MRTTEDPKTTLLRVRISPELLYQLEQYADRCGLSASEVVRQAIAEKVQDVPEVAGQRTIFDYAGAVPESMTKRKRT